MSVKRIEGRSKQSPSLPSLPHSQTSSLHSIAQDKEIVSFAEWIENSIDLRSSHGILHWPTLQGRWGSLEEPEILLGTCTVRTLTG